MLDVLDAIAKGGDDRQAVIDAFFATKKTDSVFGPYEIDKDGDTTLTTYGAYTTKGGKMVFDHSIKGSFVVGSPPWPAAGLPAARPRVNSWKPLPLLLGRDVARATPFARPSRNTA